MRLGLKTGCRQLCLLIHFESTTPAPSSVFCFSSSGMARDISDLGLLSHLKKSWPSLSEQAKTSLGCFWGDAGNWWKSLQGPSSWKRRTVFKGWSTPEEGLYTPVTLLLGNYRKGSKPAYDPDTWTSLFTGALFTSYRTNQGVCHRGAVEKVQWDLLSHKEG